MAFGPRWRFSGVVFAAALTIATTAAGALSRSATLLPVSSGVLTLGEWNHNFSGALAVADAYNVPLVVFYGGVSCGKCEDLQMACLSDEFAAWQSSHRMLMVFTTNNSQGDASGFAKPPDSTGYPFIAVYWNRDGTVPAKNSEYYRTFTGRDGEMLVQGGTLAAQLIGSIESVAGQYDFSSSPDISAHAEILYADPVTTRTAYEVKLFTGFDAADALAPQAVYNLKGTAKPKIKKVSGSLPSGVRFVYEDGVLSLSGSAKRAGACTYVFSIQQKRNGVLHVGPDISISFNVALANDAAQGGCAMLGRALKATIPLLASGGDGRVAGVLEFSATARGRVKAKYTGLSREKATFSGAWAGIDGGTASASLASGSRSLYLELDGSGRFKAALAGAAEAAALESPDGIRLGVGTYASAFAGAYAVGMTGQSGDGSDSGSVSIDKILPSGKVKWKWMLGNGKKVSGSAVAALDEEGYCVVPVFKTSSKSYVSALLEVRGAGASADSRGAVEAYGGTKAIWGYAPYPEAIHECTVQGGAQ